MVAAVVMMPAPGRSSVVSMVTLHPINHPIHRSISRFLPFVDSAFCQRPPHDAVESGDQNRGSELQRSGEDGERRGCLACLGASAGHAAHAGRSGPLLRSLESPTRATTTRDVIREGP